MFLALRVLRNRNLPTTCLIWSAAGCYYASNFARTAPARLGRVRASTRAFSQDVSPTVTRPRRRPRIARWLFRGSLFGILSILSILWAFKRPSLGKLVKRVEKPRQASAPPDTNAQGASTQELLDVPGKAWQALDDIGWEVYRLDSAVLCFVHQLSQTPDGRAWLLNHSTVQVLDSLLQRDTETQEARSNQIAIEDGGAPPAASVPAASDALTELLSMCVHDVKGGHLALEAGHDDGAAHTEQEAHGQTASAAAQASNASVAIRGAVLDAVPLFLWRAMQISLGHGTRPGVGDHTAGLLHHARDHMDSQAVNTTGHRVWAPAALLPSHAMGSRGDVIVTSDLPSLLDQQLDDVAHSIRSAVMRICGLGPRTPLTDGGLAVLTCQTVQDLGTAPGSSVESSVCRRLGGRAGAAWLAQWSQAMPDQSQLLMHGMATYQLGVLRDNTARCIDASLQRPEQVAAVREGPQPDLSHAPHPNWIPEAVDTGRLLAAAATASTATDPPVADGLSSVPSSAGGLEQAQPQAAARVLSAAAMAFTRAPTDPRQALGPEATLEAHSVDHLRGSLLSSAAACVVSQQTDLWLSQRLQLWAVQHACAEPGQQGRPSGGNGSMGNHGTSLVEALIHSAPYCPEPSSSTLLLQLLRLVDATASARHDDDRPHVGTTTGLPWAKFRAPMLPDGSVGPVPHSASLAASVLQSTYGTLTAELTQPAAAASEPREAGSPSVLQRHAQAVDELLPLMVAGPAAPVSPSPMAAAAGRHASLSSPSAMLPVDDIVTSTTGSGGAANAARSTAGYVSSRAGVAASAVVSGGKAALSALLPLATRVVRAEGVEDMRGAQARLGSAPTSATAAGTVQPIPATSGTYVPAAPSAPVSAARNPSSGALPSTGGLDAADELPLTVGLDTDADAVITPRAIQRAALARFGQLLLRQGSVTRAPCEGVQGGLPVFTVLSTAGSSSPQVVSGGQSQPVQPATSSVVAGATDRAAQSLMLPDYTDLLLACAGLERLGLGTDAVDGDISGRLNAPSRSMVDQLATEAQTQLAAVLQDDSVAAAERLQLSQRWLTSCLKVVLHQLQALSTAPTSTQRGDGAVKTQPARLDADAGQTIRVSLASEVSRWLARELVPAEPARAIAAPQQTLVDGQSASSNSTDIATWLESPWSDVPHYIRRLASTQIRAASTSGRLPSLLSELFVPRDTLSAAYHVHVLKALAYATSGLAPCSSPGAIATMEPAQAADASGALADHLRAVLVQAGVQAPLAVLADLYSRDLAHDNATVASRGCAIAGCVNADEAVPVLRQAMRLAANVGSTSSEVSTADGDSMDAWPTSVAPSIRRCMQRGLDSKLRSQAARAAINLWLRHEQADTGSDMDETAVALTDATANQEESPHGCITAVSLGDLLLPVYESPRSTPAAVPVRLSTASPDGTYRRAHDSTETAPAPATATTPVPVDIILVHGLQGAALKTWRTDVDPLAWLGQHPHWVGHRSDGGSSSQLHGGSSNWDNLRLADPALSVLKNGRPMALWPALWLAQDLQRTGVQRGTRGVPEPQDGPGRPSYGPDLAPRIIAVSYDADMLSSTSVRPPLSLPMVAQHVARQLVRAGVGAVDADGVQRRRTVWLTHSMGGLVTKEVLSHTREGREVLLPSTAAVVCYGVPHKGSSLASTFVGASRKMDSAITSAWRSAKRKLWEGSSGASAASGSAPPDAPATGQVAQTGTGLRARASRWLPGILTRGRQTDAAEAEQAALVASGEVQLDVEPTGGADSGAATAAEAQQSAVDHGPSETTATTSATPGGRAWWTSHHVDSLADSQGLTALDTDFQTALAQERLTRREGNRNDTANIPGHDQTSTAGQYGVLFLPVLSLGEGSPTPITSAVPMPDLPLPAATLPLPVPTRPIGVTVVPPSSADPGYGTFVLVPFADHITICKPSTPYGDPRYEVVLRFIRDRLSEA